MRSILTLVVITACCIAGCAPSDEDIVQPPETSGLQLSVEARPWIIPADGQSKLVVFVEFRDNGNPVSDSTKVILLNTAGMLRSGIIYTNQGVALDTLTSDTLAGLCWVIAYSRGHRDSVEIQFSE